MKIKTLVATLGIMVGLTATPLSVQAVEFTVTEIERPPLFYATEGAVLLSDTDPSAIVIPLFPGTGFVVAGITSNGYFKVPWGDIGEYCYIAGSGLTPDMAVAIAPAVAKAPDTSGWTQEKVYAALMQLKATKYPQGKVWVGEDGYVSASCLERTPEGTVETVETLGDRAFAHILMKDIFGENVILQEWREFDVSKLKVGDIIGKPGRSYIIVEIGNKDVTVVRGSHELINEGFEVIAGTVDWNIKIPIDELYQFYNGYWGGRRALFLWTAY